ncbi:carbohydrate ABC transporter permease [Clostridium sp. Marseille-P2415]|uniref:carbohydrate ABC transporter permease n=1 Tax=Clostridium sp. Marseille-P2415 TaxID=1805471 RepID=UPI0009887DB8|nr:sugar ABC transporter permease [Clostridium sp. Marseille-P2415]
MNTKRILGQRLKKSWDHGDIPMWLMLFPTIFFILVMSVYPFAWLIRYVFYDYNGFKEYYVGMANFKRLFTDTIYWNSVLHTFEYAFLKLLFVLPLSLITAVLLQRKRFGSGLIQGIYFLPTVISSAVYSLIWYFIFATYNGVLNAFLQAFGIINAPIDWLGSSKTAMTAVVIVAVWGAFGNYMILLISGLTGISSDVYESAQIDGANGIQTFFKITLPMLGPVLKVVIMLAITTAFKDYQSILVLTGGGPNNRTHVMFSYIFQMVFGTSTSSSQLQIGYGSVLSIISALIVGLVTIIYLKFSKKMDEIS